MKSVDGISDKLAWKMLAELKFEDITEISPKAQVAHAGLSTREFSSGACVRVRTHISRMGNSDMRKLLFMPALSCTRYDNYFSKFYFHLLEQGKPKKVAVVAVMRKMLLTAMGVLKNQQPFDPNWSKKVQENYQSRLTAV